MKIFPFFEIDHAKLYAKSSIVYACTTNDNRQPKGAIADIHSGSGARPAQNTFKEVIYT
jgi:hypothetical protein